MATTFLAGVANARIFRGNDMFATAKTLVDSSITIGVSAEDIRAGKGAKLYGKYFHTSTFDLKMTDAMFKMEYIAANVGARGSVDGSYFDIGGDVFKSVELEGTELAAHVFSDAVAMTNNSNEIYVYVRTPQSDEVHSCLLDNSKVIGSQSWIDTTKTYCVEYLYTNESGKKLTINANFTPDTLTVYLDADLFSGDASNPSTGTKIGTITIKVPRFLLSGSQELTMNMTGASQTPFEGSALASNASGCEGEGIYAEIIQVITGENWIMAGKELVVDGQKAGTLDQGDPIELYVITSEYGAKKVTTTSSLYTLKAYVKTTAAGEYSAVTPFPTTFATNNAQYKFTVSVGTGAEEKVILTDEVTIGTLE